ncbi:MAG: glucose-1-phosphate adenylyltransferase [Vulcanimicrobiaceae bacterium]
MVAATESRFVSVLTKQTLALILAGGRGSRLRQLTEWRAKPAVPFGGKFRIIDFPLSNCFNSGIRRVGVLTQYKAHSLIRHVQRGWSFAQGQLGEFVDLMPASQRMAESWYRGTADAVLQNGDIVRAYNPKYVIILAGDHIYKMDYGIMLASHVERGADVTVGCVEVPVHLASDYGVMDVDHEDRIVEFAEKPIHPKAIPGDPARVLASMGIYIFGTDFLLEELARDAADDTSSRDFGRDVIPHCVERHRVYAHRFSDSAVKDGGAEQGYWRDVGTVDAYWEANMELTKVQPALNLYDAKWPIWTNQHQLPPAKFVFDEEHRRGSAVDSLLSGGCIVSGASVRRSLLFWNVRIDEGSVVEDSVVLPNVRIGKNVRLRRTIIEKGCSLSDDIVIGESADDDARRFERTEGGVTLVTPAMLGLPMHVAR